MSLLDKFRNFQKKRREKNLAKSASLVANPKVAREERVAAIEYLVAQKDPHEVVPALLGRFEFSLEHGINDTREKETVMNGIAAFGAVVGAIIEEHLRTTTRIAWPIKTLKKIAPPEQVRDALVASLDFSDISFDQQKVDKNYDVLCYLHEYQLPAAAITSLFAFLANLDERVRFATVETLIEQRSHEVEIARHLEPFLRDHSPENSRIHQAVVEAFIKHKWQLNDRENFKVGPFDFGVIVNNNYQLEASPKF